MLNELGIGCVDVGENKECGFIFCEDVVCVVVEMLSEDYIFGCFFDLVLGDMFIVEVI